MTGVANPGEMLAPYRSYSHEVGVKAPVSVFSVNLAVFRIERPFSFTDPVDNVFKLMGNQVNYGAELMATGQVFSGLTAYGGVTFLDPRLKDTGRATTSDKQVVGVPKTQANLLLEYTLPALPRLAVNANLHRTGKRPANDTNTSWVVGYGAVDLGVRYTLATQWTCRPRCGWRWTTSRTRNTGRRSSRGASTAQAGATVPSSVSHERRWRRCRFVFSSMFNAPGGCVDALASQAAGRGSGRSAGTASAGPLSSRRPGHGVFLGQARYFPPALSVNHNVKPSRGRTGSNR